MLEDLGIIVKRLRHDYTWPNFRRSIRKLRTTTIIAPATFCVDRRSHDADYLSKSIGSDCINMNAFSNNPNLVVVDRNQASLIQFLEKQGLM